MTQQKLTLVLGGTGKTGRRVATRLRARGQPIRISSRSGGPPFDWADPATWAPALQDVGSVYLAYSPDIGDPSAAPTIRSFAELAVTSGVRRLVLLSARGEEAALPAEQVVQEAGADWTIVRGSWFFQNFSEGILLEPVRSGEVVFPAGDTPQYGFPPEVGAFLSELFAELLDGRNSHLTDGVGRSLGREPRDFADYARDAAATGVWAT